MAPKNHNDSTMTPPLSLEDDDQDEDFVASENESLDSDAEASDSDESSEEGSDTDDDPAPPADLPADLQATLRQALEGEKVLDEPILSDSEISREFPEEEDDVFGALAGSDFDSDDDDAASGATGSEGSALEVRRAASTIAAAQSVAATAAVTRGAAGGRAAAAAGPVGPSPTATATRRRTRFGEEALSEQGLAGPQLIPLSSAQDPRPTSPPLEVFGAMLPPLENNNNNNDNDGATSRPIAQRTRAHVSLMDVTIEELEDQLAPAAGGNEPLLYFGVDDAAEWVRFISGLQTNLDFGVNTTGNGMLSTGVVGVGGGDGTTGALNTNGTAGGGTNINNGDTEFEDDSDDEDFMVELERMLQEDEAARLHGFDMNLGISLPDDYFNYNGHGGGGGGGGKQYSLRNGKGSGGSGRSRKRRKVEKPPRRSARLIGNTVAAERPRFVASMRDRMTGKATAAAIQQGIVDVNPALQQAYGSAIGAQVPLFGGLDELATLASALATGPPMALPSDMGKPGVAAAMKTVVWRAPLPKAMRRFDHSAQPDESAPIVGAHFQASQYSDLYLSIHYHIQQLVQTTAMAVATSDHASASAGAKMLRAMEVFVTNQTNTRKAGGIPAYVSACLGIDTGEGLGEEAGGAGAAGDSRLGTLGRHASNTRWTPQNPGNVYTVADVCVLRAVPRMLELLPSLSNGGDNGAGEEGIPASELDNRLPMGGAVGTGTAAGGEGAKKKRRRGKLPTTHPIWDSLSADVILALGPVRRFFDPNMEPKPPTFLTTSQMLFTPAEDELLAWGIRKHLYDWDKIVAELLPTKEPKTLKVRKNNRCISAAPDSILKQVVSLIVGELTLAEEVLIIHALEYYGKQHNRWDIICKEHLPHRHPRVLSMLWGHRQKKLAASGGGASGGGGGVTVAAVTAAAAALPRANQGLVMNAEGGGGGVEAPMSAEMIVQQQQQFLANQQMVAAATGAFNTAAVVAAATMPPWPLPSSLEFPGWMADPNQGAVTGSMQPPPYQQQQQQQQQEGGAAGLSAPRLVEWDQQPGEDEAAEQPREAPPRNFASSLHDIFTGRAAAPAEAVWAADEDKAILKAALSSGGKLREQQVEELMKTLNRSKDEISARSEVLVERFLEKARQERQRRQAAA